MVNRKVNSTMKIPALFSPLGKSIVVASLLLSSVAVVAAPVPMKDDISYQRARDARDAQMAQNANPSPLNQQDINTMAAFNQHLKDTMPEPGIRVGEQAPDFTLTNAFGKKVNLYQELKKGPVVLVFYRGSWCPYCNLHLYVLNKAKPQFDQYNAQIIAVTPQQPDRSKAQIEKDGYPFEVLSDTTSKVMKDYQLYFQLTPELLTVYKKFNLDIESYNGIGRTVLPVPGSFVIDQNGKVIAMQAQVDYKARMEPTDILAALAKL